MADTGRTEPIPTGETSNAPSDPDQHTGPVVGSGASHSRTADARSRDSDAGARDRDSDAGGRDRDAGSGASSDRRGPDLSDPIAAAKDPDTRAVIALVTAGVTILNLVLLAIVLANVTGDRFEQVTVDGQPCVIQSGEDESTLYCAQ